jgi:hypothetical protein
MQPVAPLMHCPRSSLMIRAVALEASLVLTDSIDPTSLVGTTLSDTVILKWREENADLSCRAASPGFEMTMTTLVLDAPAGASDCKSARGTAAMPIMIAAKAVPTRRLGFRKIRSRVAPPRKFRAMDHYGIPSSRRAEMSSVASSPWRERHRAG